MSMSEESKHSAIVPDDLPRWLVFRGRTQTPYKSGDHLASAVSDRPYAPRVMAVIDRVTSAGGGGSGDVS